MASSSPIRRHSGRAAPPAASCCCRPEPLTAEEGDACSRVGEGLWGCVSGGWGGGRGWRGQRGVGRRLSCHPLVDWLVG